MIYSNITHGVFIERPNRFIALVEINGKIETCHVKNTGRCRELLIRGSRVILEISSNPSRKTKYDLIAVYKGNELINIDSQAPNKVFYEWLNEGNFFGDATLIKPECTYKSSRFDFYVEAGDKQIFIEVKGVTLERDGIVLFPDAPTERGVKHLRELIDAVKNDYDAYVCFVIQMRNCRYFTPNSETHLEFADTLKEAQENGVKIIALKCNVSENKLSISDFVDTIIE